MFELIRELSDAFGVSGNEEEIRDLITKKIETLVDEIKIDTLGNLIAVKRGVGRKIMFAAHMDEIGLMATYIDEKGFVRFSNIGWVSPFYSLSQRVRFKNGITGVIYYEEKLEDMKNLKLSSMYIDIGARSREEALNMIKIGDTAAFIGEAYSQNGLIFGKALDNRAGCGVLIELIKNLKKTEDEIYFVFTVQEELGLRGAKTAAFRLEPDFAIAVDVTLTGDIPGCKPMEVALGKGPAVKIKDSSIIANPMVKGILEEAAKAKQLKYQYEILESGGNDSGAIQQVLGGIPSGALSIPSRYVHSPSECVSIDDLEGAVKLLLAIVK